MSRGRSSPNYMQLYLAECQKQIDKKQKSVNKKVNDWYTFSTTPQTEEDIREKLIKELEENQPGKYMCLSYVCRYSTLSEEFIEEIIELSQAKIKKDNRRKYKAKDRKCYGEYTSRLDWRNICRYQKLSEEFIERHKNDVLWNYIFQFQDLSEEFKKEHKSDYDKTSLIEGSDEESENIH